MFEDGFNQAATKVATGMDRYGDSLAGRSFLVDMMATGDVMKTETVFFDSFDELFCCERGQSRHSGFYWS